MDKEEKVFIFKLKNKKRTITCQENSHNFKDTINRKFQIDEKTLKIHGFLNESNRFINLDDFLDNFNNYYENDVFSICLKEIITSKVNETLRYMFNKNYLSNNLHKNSQKNDLNINFFTLMNKIQNFSNFQKVLKNHVSKKPFIIIFLVNNSKNLFKINKSTLEFLEVNFDFFYKTTKNNINNFLLKNKIKKTPFLNSRENSEYILIYFKKQIIFSKELERSDKFLKNVCLEFQRRLINKINLSQDIIKKNDSINNLNISDFEKILINLIESIYSKKLFINEYIKLKFVISKNKNVVEKLESFYEKSNNLELLEKEILKMLKVFLQPENLDDFLDEEDLIDIIEYIKKQKMIDENISDLIITNFESVFIMQEEKIAFLNVIRIMFVNFINSEILIDNFVENIFSKLEEFLLRKLSRMKEILYDFKIFDLKTLNIVFECIDNKEIEIIEAFDAFFYNKDENDLIETLKLFLEEKEDNKKFDYSINKPLSEGQVYKEEDEDEEEQNKNLILNLYSEEEIEEKKYKKPTSDSERDDYIIITDKIEKSIKSKSKKSQKYNNKASIYKKEDLIMNQLNENSILNAKTVYKSAKLNTIINMKNINVMKSLSVRKNMENLNSLNLNESISNKDDVFINNSNTSSFKNNTMIKRPRRSKKNEKYKKIITLHQTPPENDNKSKSDISIISKQISNYITSSGSSGKQDKENFKKKVYTHILLKINDLIKETCDNIKILYSNIYSDDGFFNNKLNNYLKKKERGILPILFTFKWHPVENKKLVENLHDFLNVKENEFSYETILEEVNEKCEQREEINIFYGFLLDFMNEHKQLLTRKQVKYFKNHLLLSDDLFLLSNLEYFLTCNNIEDFIDNLYEYEKINFKINKSTRSIFCSEKTTIDEVEEFFPGLLHSIPTSFKRKNFLNLVRNRDEEIIKLLFSDPYQKKDVKFYVNKICKYLEKIKNNKSKMKIKKNPSSWNLKLYEIISSLPKKIWKNYSLVVFLLELLKRNKLYDDNELKSIYKVYNLTKDKGDIFENIGIYCEILNLKKNSNKIKELNNVFQKHGLSQKKSKLFIKHFFNKSSEFWEECHDFYDIFLYTKNAENFIDNINCLY